CFNVEEKEGVNADSELVNSPQQFVELYRGFLQRFLDLGLQRNSKLMVREFENAFNGIQHYRVGRSVNFQIQPFGIIAVDINGNFSTFSPELLGVEHPTYGSFGYGNVLTDDFDTLARRVTESKLFSDIKSGVAKCEAECQYFPVCGGGAPANKI